MFLSFIIPVYNTEEYVRICIKSLLEQDISKDEYEIICVNDGSSDGSLEVLEQFSRNHTNIIIINQKNSGVCVSRNKGLDAARGEYIWFIDSDDFIQKNILGTLVKLVKDTQCERLVISHYFFEDTRDVDRDRIIENKMKVNTSWKDSVVWRSLFKKEFLTHYNLRFHYEDLVYGEDALFMYEVKRRMPKSIEFTQPIYFHRARNGSASTDITNEMERKRLLSTIHEAAIMREYYEKGGNILRVETANRFMSFLWGALFRTASLPPREARLMLRELRKAKLYPYKCPEECNITRSFHPFNNQFIEKIFDKVYIKMHTTLGYHTMRSWIKLRRTKNDFVVLIKKLIK